jgi:HAD superfamily hydrolase (TIGR01509 family)
MTPKAVIFDCDGVVVDSEPMTFELLADDFASHGLPLSVEVIARDFIGGTMTDVAARARAAGADLPETWVETFYQRLYAHLAAGTPLIPGILGVLDALEAAGIPFAMGSNGSDEKMQITLGQHPGLLAHFQGHLYSGQTLGAPKPAPDLYLHAARQLGVAPTECVVIEDSVPGTIAGIAAGMRVLSYCGDPHGDREGLAAAGGELFDDMRDLSGLIGLDQLRPFADTRVRA